MSTDAPATGAVPGGASVRGWRAAFPPAQWLLTYRASWLPNDAIAGVTLAAYGIPVSLAYASLAGLPPQYGVYGYLAGGLGYALFGSSRQLAIGPTSAISSPRARARWPRTPSTSSAASWSGSTSSPSGS